MDEFVKHDSNKARFDLIDPFFHEEMAIVLTIGANKYSEDNFKKGTIERYIAAGERHLNAIKKGEMYDPESGLQHATHVATNMMFIHWLIEEDVAIEEERIATTDPSKWVSMEEEEIDTQSIRLGSLSQEAWDNIMKRVEES